MILVEDMSITRRDFLRHAMTVAAIPLYPGNSIFKAVGRPFNNKTLSFYNIHTGERLNTVYWEQGRYLSDALAGINRIMRDHRTGEIIDIEVELLDLLHTIKQELGAPSEPFCIISGYRSPLTNNVLHQSSRGVARNSLHMYGKAVDIRLPGVELTELRNTAIDLARGGVGYYPASDFVHVDTGRVHTW